MVYFIILLFYHKIFLNTEYCDKKIGRQKRWLPWHLIDNLSLISAGQSSSNALNFKKCISKLDARIGRIGFTNLAE